MRARTSDAMNGTRRMSFEALIAKVKQAEGALEARERQGEADWRQFKSTWRAAWTPGRIVVAGVLSGFLIGRAQLGRHVGAASTLRLLSTVSSLFAVSRADDAAAQAHDAAQAAQDAVDTPPTPPSSAHGTPVHEATRDAATPGIPRDEQAGVSTRADARDPRRAKSKA